MCILNILLYFVGQLAHIEDGTRRFSRRLPSETHDDARTPSLPRSPTLRHVRTPRTTDGSTHGSTGHGNGTATTRPWTRWTAWTTRTSAQIVHGATPIVRHNDG